MCVCVCVVSRCVFQAKTRPPAMPRMDGKPSLANGWEANGKMFTAAVELQEAASDMQTYARTKRSMAISAAVSAELHAEAGKARSQAISAAISAAIGSQRSLAISAQLDAERSRQLEDALFDGDFIPCEVPAPAAACKKMAMKPKSKAKAVMPAIKPKSKAHAVPEVADGPFSFQFST